MSYGCYSCNNNTFSSICEKCGRPTNPTINNMLRKVEAARDDALAKVKKLESISIEIGGIGGSQDMYDSIKAVAIIAELKDRLAAMEAVERAARVVSSQRNGPYLMADMDTTLKAESDLKQALKAAGEVGK